MMGDMDRVDKEQLFPSVEGSITRLHEFKMRGTGFGGDVRINLFFYPECGDGLQCAAWEVVGSGLPDIFMKYLDEHWSSITFRVMRQILADRIRWQCSCF